MHESVFGMEWAEFVSSLNSGTANRPFLVCEQDDEGKEAWFLYAVTPRMLIQVLTNRKTRRSWRELDRAISSLRRDLQVMPPITLFNSAEDVDLDALLRGASSP